MSETREDYEYEARQYETKDRKSPFDRWFKRLESYAAVKVRRAIARLEAGKKPPTPMVRPGVYEAKIDFGPGYRVYFGLDGDQLILLGGGDKRTQQDDIGYAHAAWLDYKERKGKSID